MKAVGKVLFRATVRLLVVLVRDGAVRLVERRYGIRTSGVVELEELGLASPDRQRYKPAPWLTLRRSVAPRSISEEDVFLDLGSGMGRIVFQAAMRYPFKRVIGVELSPTLHRIASENIDRNRRRLRCRQVRLFLSDVLDYPIPDDVTVVFMANPFTGDIFTAVADRILASFDDRPRPLRIVYFNPVEHEWLMATGRFRLVKRVRGLRPGREWSRGNSTHVYQVLPALAVTGASAGRKTGARLHPADPATRSEKQHRIEGT